VGIRCHLAGISIKNASQFFDELGVQRSHVAVHNWVHKADPQPLSTVTSDQLAVDERVIRTNGDDYWLYGAVDPETNETLQFRLFPTTTEQTIRWFLTELHQRYRLDGVEFLVGDADHLVNILDEDGYRFQMISHENRNAIERIF
jgi:transposase-like protein